MLKNKDKNGSHGTKGVLKKRACLFSGCFQIKIIEKSNANSNTTSKIITNMFLLSSSSGKKVIITQNTRISMIPSSKHIATVLYDLSVGSLQEEFDFSIDGDG